MGKKIRKKLMIQRYLIEDGRKDEQRQIDWILLLG